MIINHVNNSTIWFHSTPSYNIDKILKEGLRINSIPTYETCARPWIYVSTIPFNPEELVTLKVNLNEIQEYNVGWPFVDDNNWNERWQLRVFVNIPPNKISLL